MKIKIFISGNQTELQQERFAVKEAINNSPILEDIFDIFLFEDLPAIGRDPVSAYLNEVENSDIYIGIIGSVYGTPNEEGISPTELEFQRFIETNPHNDTFIYIKDISTERDEGSQKFIDKIKKLVKYQRFKDLEDLKGHVTDSLVLYLYENNIIHTEPFDMTINTEADYDDINENEVTEFLEKRATELNLGVPSRPINDFLLNILKVLKKYRGEIKPTNTGLLFFGKDPSKFILQNEIRIARFKGITRLEMLDSQEIKGPIYKMLDNVESFYRRNTRVANKIVEFKRIDIPEYPYEAIREALINAIAHRDYERTGGPIMFSIFDDRIEISNPGGLVSGLTINDIEGKHETRNKKICEIFSETKDMERFGTGITKMKELMSNYGLKEPEFLEERDNFIVKFYGPGDDILDLVSSIPEERAVDLKDLGLKDIQIQALTLMVNEREEFTNESYSKLFNVHRNTATRHLKRLVELELIEKTGKGRYTKYKAI